MFEETTSTLLCGDLFSQVGAGPALRSDDVVEAALLAESMFGSMSMAPHTHDTLAALAALEPTTLAIMHGSSFRGDGAAALGELSAGLREARAA